MSIVITLVVAWAALGTLVLALVVAQDARQRGLSPLLWFAVAIVMSVFGVLAYLVVRPAERLADLPESADLEHEAPITLAASARAEPEASRWEPVRSAPGEVPAPREVPASRDLEPPVAVDDDYGPDPVGSRSPARTWLFVGALVVLGLVVAGALFAYVSSPSASTIDASRRAAPTAVPTRVPTRTAVVPLLAPTSTSVPEATEAASPTETPTGGPIEYTVRAGDTLTLIADRYGVSVQQLQQENGLSGETIIEGQRLKIPARAP